MNHKGTVLILFAAAALSCLGSPTSAQTTALGVELSPSEVLVGDLVTATLAIELDVAAPEPSFPNWPRHWGSAEIRNIGEVTRSEVGASSPGSDGSGSPDSRTRYSQTLLLTAFRPGSVTLPPAVVTLNSDETVLEVASEPTTFEVGSVLPPGEEQLEPKPPAPPRPLPIGDRFWWTAGLLALFAAGLLALILTRRSAEPTYAGQTIDPWQAFELALARLATAADPETVFTGLSLELRRYLGSCLAFPAAESTTTELRRRLLRFGLPASVSGDVVRLLVEADTVKFAKRTPAPGRDSECLEQARIAATEVRGFLQRQAMAEAEEGEVAA
ncbi:MAG: hypothetical protein GY769_16595 [bacterium]|nr:hypothetical protein [bacterium]